MSPSITYAQVSSVAVGAVRDLLTRDDQNGFNYVYSQIAPGYGAPSFTLSPSNLILGRIDPISLTQAGGPSFLSYPLMVLSPGRTDSMGREAIRITPSTFSGTVVVSLDMYVKYPNSGVPVDGNAVGFAFEDALVNTLNQASAYGLYPGGLIYNNEIVMDFGKMEYTETFWLQCMSAGIGFQLIV